MNDCVITPAASATFGRLSGDFNCQHLDPIRARRLPFGRTVVHGLHTVLTALDLLAAQRQASFALTKIRVSFLAPIFQGEGFVVAIDDKGETVAIIVRTAEGPVANVTVTLTTTKRDAEFVSERCAFDPVEPIDIDEETITRASGDLDLHFDVALGTALFPHATAFIDHDQLAALLATTRIVGMKCPGERSIFKFLSLAFDGAARVPALTYKIERFEPVSALASISLSGSWVLGAMHAVLRAKPVPQQAYATIKARVAPGLFRDQHVLVVGGARGLGEAAAKMASAGGAHVTIGYALGKADAARVAQEIAAGGGSVETRHVDILADAQDFSGLTRKVSHIYYFASPKISLNLKTNIDHRLLADFFAFYVTGLERIIAGLVDTASIVEGDLVIFVPSSVFVEEAKHGAFEYAAAKAVAEVYGRYCSTKFKRPIMVHAPRLPMLPTDQTSTVDDKLPQPVDILISLLPMTDTQR